jgi:hypothetical protein
MKFLILESYSDYQNCNPNILKEIDVILILDGVDFLVVKDQKTTYNVGKRVKAEYILNYLKNY